MLENIRKRANELYKWALYKRNLLIFSAGIVALGLLWPQVLGMFLVVASLSLVFSEVMLRAMRYDKHVWTILYEWLKEVPEVQTNNTEPDNTAENVLRNETTQGLTQDQENLHQGSTGMTQLRDLRRQYFSAGLPQNAAITELVAARGPRPS